MPFHGTADVLLRTHHLHSPAPPVRSRRGDVPETVDALVSSMLVKNPRARPSAERVYEALLPFTTTSLEAGDKSRDGTPRVRSGGR